MTDAFDKSWDLVKDDIKRIIEMAERGKTPSKEQRLQAKLLTPAEAGEDCPVCGARPGKGCHADTLTLLTHDCPNDLVR